MEIKEQPCFLPAPQPHPVTHNFERAQMPGREGCWAQRQGWAEGGSALKADQKHFQVKIKPRRWQEANLMGTVPVLPVPSSGFPWEGDRAVMLLIRETPGYQILSK